MNRKYAQTRAVARDIRKEQIRLFKIGTTMTLIMFLISSLVS